MADLGLLALVVAFVVALFGIAANLIGALAEAACTDCSRPQCTLRGFRFRRWPL